MRYPGKKYEEIEDDLALDYERNRADSPLPWDQARHATRAAWMKVSGAVAPPRHRAGNSKRSLAL
jgi:hypothetical protein